MRREEDAGTGDNETGTKADNRLLKRKPSKYAAGRPGGKILFARRNYINIKARRAGTMGELRPFNYAAGRPGEATATN